MDEHKDHDTEQCFDGNTYLLKFIILVVLVFILIKFVPLRLFLLSFSAYLIYLGCEEQRGFPIIIGIILIIFTLFLYAWDENRWCERDV